jgi:thiol:disulfide interchange protein DsbC
MLAAGMPFLAASMDPCSSAFAGCPPQTLVQERLERLTKNKADVIAIRAFGPAGMCEVAVRSGTKTNLLYTDAEGKYFFFGRLVEAETGRNLTDESLASLNRFTDREMEELAALTAFSIGPDSAPVLYYVTDPQCPYCKRGEEDLKKLAALGRVHVRFLLMPLQSHKGSMEQCVSVICDKKGLEEFEAGYRSENQCEEGRMLVGSTVDFLKKKGVSGTPAYIFQDGRMRGGLLNAADLERWLNPEDTTREPGKTEGAGAKDNTPRTNHPVPVK